MQTPRWCTKKNCLSPNKRERKQMGSESVIAIYFGFKNALTRGMAKNELYRLEDCIPALLPALANRSPLLLSSLKVCD